MASGYTFRVLRYAHDPITGERLNAGVLVVAAEYAELRVVEDLSRFAAAFPDIDLPLLRRQLDQFAEAVAGVQAPPASSAELTRTLFGDDGEGSFIWSTEGSGVGDPRVALDRLIVRMTSGRST